MKKLLYILPVLAISLASCEDFFDEKQLGNKNPQVSDIRTDMNYTFTDDDYAAVSKNAANIDKALALCTPEDSSAYQNLLAIGKNKCFTEDASADMYAGAVMQTKFPYIDNGSLCNVNYRLLEGKSAAVLPFQTSTSYKLTVDDYEKIWNKRGVSYLTPASLKLLPAFMAEKFPSVADKKIIVLTYEYRDEEPNSAEFSDFLPYALSLSQLLAFPDYKEHEISGTVGTVKSTTYGRFYMLDGADSIYVYGLNDEDGNKVWKAKGIAEGDQITIRATYSDVNEEPQLINGIYVSHSAGVSAPRRAKAAIKTTTTTAAYQLNLGEWAEYSNDQLARIVTLQAADYDKIGSATISSTDVLAKFLKVNYPYAAIDDEYLVVYAIASGSTADLFVFDGTDFVMNTGYVDETMSFEVKNGQWIANISTYLRQAFVGEGLGKFTIQHINLDGLSYVWRYQAAYGATASAYVSSVNHRVEDWLISPTIRLKKAVHPEISFMQAVRYGSTEHNGQWLSVMVTNNFTGDVTTTEWTKLEFPEEMPDGSNWTFLTTGKVDLSEYNDQKIVIAFRYNTNIDGIEVASAPTWEIQQLLIAEPEE